jgi:hypothetical protein
LLGFFTTLPGIWRALQCIRRYYDTRNVFPHLVNCGKYAATIIFYVTLSIYRIDKNESNRAIFITFAIINSIYTSTSYTFMLTAYAERILTTSHRYMGRNNGLESWRPLRPEPLPPPYPRLQTRLVLLRSHGHRPHPPLQLDLLCR